MATTTTSDHLASRLASAYRVASAVVGERVESAVFPAWQCDLALTSTCALRKLRIPTAIAVTGRWGSAPELSSDDTVLAAGESCFKRPVDACANRELYGRHRPATTQPFHLRRCRDSRFPNVAEGRGCREELALVGWRGPSERSRGFDEFRGRALAHTCWLEESHLERFQASGRRPKHSVHHETCANVGGARVGLRLLGSKAIFFSATFFTQVLPRSSFSFAL